MEKREAGNSEAQQLEANVSQKALGVPETGECKGAWLGGFAVGCVCVCVHACVFV